MALQSLEAVCGFEVLFEVIKYVWYIHSGYCVAGCIETQLLAMSPKRYQLLVSSSIGVVSTCTHIHMSVHAVAKWHLQEYKTLKM